METISISEKKEVEILQKTTLLGKELTVYGNAENPLFLAKDVADWIEHSNASKMVSDADLSETDCVKDTLSTLTNSYSALFLTEEGLYEVLMQSRKPIAKQFKKGVKEILKEIRTKGAYMVTTAEDTPETIMAKAILYADKKIKEQAQQLNEEKSVRYELEQEAVANKPKIDWAVRNQESKGLHTVSSCVQEQRICADFMNKVLEQYKIQRKLSGEWALTAPWQNKGFAEAVPSIIERDGKDDKTTLQLKWFEKGRRLMLQLIKHADADGFIYINKKTGRYSISKTGHGFTPFKFID